MYIIGRKSILCMAWEFDYLRLLIMKKIDAND
jgi:hypothetical protein